MVRGLDGHDQLLIWVIGAWQEGSKDLNILIDIVVKGAVHTDLSHPIHYL